MSVPSLTEILPYRFGGVREGLSEFVLVSDLHTWLTQTRGETDRTGLKSDIISGCYRFEWSTPAASTIIQLTTRFSRILIREGGFCFCPYIQGLWRFSHLSKPFSVHHIFPIFPPFILCLAPGSPFCSDLVRFASGNLYHYLSRTYAKSPFWVVVLSLRPVLQPDLFFEPPER